MVTTAQKINQKPGYKQTEVGIVPEDWDVKKLRECCTKITDGTHDTPKPTKEGIPFLTAIHVKVNYIDFESCYFLPQSVHEIIYKRCNPQRNDVLMVNIGAGVATTALVNVDYEFSLKNVALLKPNNHILIGPFLNYFQEYVKNKITNSISTGGAQPFLSLSQIGDLLIVVPTKSEQTAIATVLSDTDALIEHLEKLIAKKRDIKQATMQQLLTGKMRLPGFTEEWVVKKLGEIFQFLNTANNSRSDLSEDGEIEYIHYGDIHMKWRSFLDCSSDELPLIEKDKVGNVSFLEDGDLVMADASEDYEGIGISVELKNATGRKVVAGLHTFLLRGDKEVLADGFKGYLQYIPEVKDSLRKAATGISVYGISKNNVKNISICLPEITEQTAIAAVLSSMDAEIGALSKRGICGVFWNVKGTMMHSLTKLYLSFIRWLAIRSGASTILTRTFTACCATAYKSGLM